MNEWIEAYKHCRENRAWTFRVLVIAVVAMGIGAYAGTLAYYNGWLG